MYERESRVSSIGWVATPCLCEETYRVVLELGQEVLDGKRALPDPELLVGFDLEDVVFTRVKTYIINILFN